MAKLTYDDLEQVYYLYDNYGFNEHDLAGRFKVSPASIKHYLKPKVQDEMRFEIRFRKKDSRTEFQRAVEELGLTYDPNAGYFMGNTPVRATEIVDLWKGKKR